MEELVGGYEKGEGMVTSTFLVGQRDTFTWGKWK
jgi:hypothetical protein